MSGPEIVTLARKDGGGRVSLALRAGVVVGAMGADPAAWLGLTEAQARKLCRR